MPIHMTFDQPPAGIALTSALPGEDSLISTKAYLSSEDGNDFISHLEGIWGYFGPSLREQGVMPSQIDHFLALVSPNLETRLFCNEFQQRAQVRAKRAIEAGEAVFKDDIATIEKLVLHDAGGIPIEIPSDHGIVFIMSVGWRKCLYYDFSLFGPESQPRSMEMTKLFGKFYQHLLFQEMYSITDEQWIRMVEWGWFPFIWMNADERKKVINFSGRQTEPRQLFEEICRRYQSLLRQRMESWRANELLKEHWAFIEKGAERYLADDFISAIQVLYPRIEGVMRKLHLLRRPDERAQQRTMVEALVADKSDYSLLLPHRFREYLLGFYFRAFDQATGDTPLSRHTVAHGASLPEDYDLVKASLGFMIFDQMFYYLLD